MPFNIAILISKNVEKENSAFKFRKNSKFKNIYIFASGIFLLVEESAS